MWSWRASFWRAHAAQTGLCCLVGGALGIAIFHGSQLASGLAQVPGDELDARFVSYLAEHLYLAALGKTRLLSPAMYFPAPGALAYSDVHVLIAAGHALLRSLGMGMLAATAASVIALNAATYAMFFVLLACELRFSPLGAMSGAFLFAFSSPKLNQLSHLQHQVLVLLPAMAWCLLRALRAAGGRATWGSLALFSLLLHVQLWSSYQVGWFWILYLSIALLLVLARRAPRKRAIAWAARHVRGTALLVAANLLAFVPFVVFYARAAAEVGWRSWHEVLPSLPRPWSYLSMGPNIAWGWLPRSLPVLRAMPLPWEQELGFGLLGSSLVAASFGWSLARYARRHELLKQGFESPEMRADLVSLSCLASLVLFAATLNVHYVSLWRIAYAVLPGAAAVRTVSRYVLVAAFGPALFAALVVDRLERRIATLPALRRRLALGAIVLLVGAFMLEQVGGPQSFDSHASQARVDALIAQLRAQPECEVFAVEVRGARPVIETAQVDAMLASIQTGIPTVNGYSSFAPRGWEIWNLEPTGYAARVADWATARDLHANICFVRDTR